MAKKKETVPLSGVVTEVGSNFFVVKVENPNSIDVENWQEVQLDFVVD